MASLFFIQWKKYSVFFLLFLSVNTLIAQFSVRLQLKTDAKTHPSDTLFLAGNFNGWNPRDTAYQFTKNNTRYFIEVKDVFSKSCEFKITRGYWSRVETNTEGTSLPNRKLQVYADTSVELTVAGWSDDYYKTEKTHTASAHVTIMDTAFEMPALGRTRKIWLYLPEGYSTSKRHYPVLYMQDGQNLFDDYTAPFGEWGVDEWMDSLISTGKPPCIVVGIENGPRRMNEYNPFFSEKFGEGEGQQYVDFMVNTLKPYIDEHYKTLPARENTIVAGSSMGGLISYYAMLKYPQVFGKAGIFSPAFWTCASIGAFTDSLAKGIQGKFFFYAGSEEGEQYVEDMKLLQEKLGKCSSAMLFSVIDATGKHNEEAWKKWFGEFFCWIMAQGFNSVTKTSD